MCIYGLYLRMYTGTYIDIESHRLPYVHLQLTARNVND